MIRNFADQKMILDKSKKSIFLAGPTLRNETFEKSWRKDACEILEANEFDGIVYIPEYKEGNNPFDFSDQVEWERDGLMNADYILFYIPRKLPDLPGFTTNVEFGMYLSKRPNNTVLCTPPDSEKNRYLEWLYLKEKPSSKLYKNLNDVLIDIINNNVL